MQINNSFNPHTHEGCDSHGTLSSSSLFVSIHTPTKGVTFEKWVSAIHQRVSIHTPTKGVTGKVLTLCMMLVCFNPHTHEGCDLVATRRQLAKKCFNPHTHEGCDYLVTYLQVVMLVSIHTPTKGVTQLTSILCLHTDSFNPHTHEGCDLNMRELIFLLIVSIHTPTKGVTKV